MLTHRVTKRIDLAHEPGAWIEVRMPGKAILDNAREAGMRKTLERVAGIDLSQYKDLAPQTEREANPADGLDWQVLLGECVIAWSYGDPVTPENIAELDEVTVGVVIDALIPILTEAEQKNG